MVAEGSRLPFVLSSQKSFVSCLIEFVLHAYGCSGSGGSSVRSPTKQVLEGIAAVAHAVHDWLQLAHVHFPGYRVRGVGVVGVSAVVLVGEHVVAVVAIDHGHRAVAADMLLASALFELICYPA